MKTKEEMKDYRKKLHVSYMERKKNGEVKYICRNNWSGRDKTEKKEFLNWYNNSKPELTRREMSDKGLVFISR